MPKKRHEPALPIEEPGELPREGHRQGRHGEAPVRDRTAARRPPPAATPQEAQTAEQAKEAARQDVARHELTQDVLKRRQRQLDRAAHHKPRKR